MDQVQNITKIQLSPDTERHRVNPQNIRIYTKETYGNYTFLPRDRWAIEKDARGRLFIYFTPELAARYIKIHCDFDDRNADRSIADKAEFKNLGSDLIRIYRRVGWRIENYSFDALGNRTQERITLHSTDTYDYFYYANSNRLKVNGRYAFTYDENGNLIKKGNKYTINGEDVTFQTSGLDVEYWEYDYDLLNCLVAVRKNGAEIASYIYDPTGLRIEKKSQKGTFCYVYNLAGEVMLKIDVNHNKQSRYIYVMGKTFAREDVTAEGTTKTFFHTDIQGNIMQATDEHGNTKWKRDFLPFGMSASVEGNVDEEAGFTGKDFDEEIGMYYFNARWYDPELGRFAEEDPMADDPNLYSYGFNSPLNYTDPTGMIGIAGFSNGGFNALQFAGAVVNAYAALNPKAAKASQIFGLFVSLYNMAVKIKQAEEIKARALEQEIEQSINIVYAGVDKHGTGYGGYSKPESGAKEGSTTSNIIFASVKQSSAGSDGSDLSVTHQLIISMATSTKFDEDVKQWTTWDTIKYLTDHDSIFEFKKQWLLGYSEVIKSAADYYDIPALLLGGVAFTEVGGDPLWIDDVAFNVRKITGNHGKDADRTSFGNLSIQISTAAETLGYDPKNLSDSQRKAIINSLKDPRQSIFIAAKHLSDLGDIDFKGEGANELSFNDMRIIATRYNRGPSLSLKQIQKNTSYGDSIIKRITLLGGLLYGGYAY